MTHIKNILFSVSIITLPAFISACALVEFNEAAQETAQNPTSTALLDESDAATQGVAALDSDQDGVTNAEDQCAQTPAGAWVDVRGCALDTDGDKVADYRDNCRGTPRGVSVDTRGCGFDDDRDGVPNHRDHCAGTRNVSVDGSGCEWDSDNDGVVDSKDLCVGTPPGVVVEPMGCLLLEVVTLKGVHFKTGSDVLNNNAQSILSNVAQTLRKHPRMRVEISGHTDNTGTEEINRQLSAQRANVTKQFLINLGISENVLSERAYAAEQPIAPNNTQAGRSQNRRVEMRIVEVD